MAKIKKKITKSVEIDGEVEVPTKMHEQSPDLLAELRSENERLRGELEHASAEVARLRGELEQCMAAKGYTKPKNPPRKADPGAPPPHPRHPLYTG